MPKRLLIVLTLMFAATAVSAQSQKPAESTSEVEVRYNKRTTITYGETDVTGTIKKPTGTRIQAGPRVKFAPRLPIRTSFRRELLNSSSNL